MQQKFSHLAIAFGCSEEKRVLGWLSMCDFHHFSHPYCPPPSPAKLDKMPVRNIALALSQPVCSNILSPLKRSLKIIIIN
jgi:hypothetical protein